MNVAVVVGRESGIRRFREVRDRMGQFAMHLLHVNAAESEENTSFAFDRKFYRTFDRHIRYTAAPPTHEYFIFS